MTKYFSQIILLAGFSSAFSLIMLLAGCSGPAGEMVKKAVGACLQESIQSIFAACEDDICREQIRAEFPGECFEENCQSVVGGIEEK